MDAEEPRVCDFEKQNEVRIVPWISMSEWREVYHQIYSNNLRNKRNGFESLRVWKSRVKTLPNAVECTIILLHVVLKDEEYCAEANNFDFGDEEQNLRMMYCTAITRCLNQILAVDPKKSSMQSMFAIGRGLDIPQWVIQIRHDASHGINLPSLGVLRKGASLLTTWLHDYYWKQEEDSTWDWEPGAHLLLRVNKLTRLMDAWQSLNIFAKANLRAIGHIPDASLRAELIDTVEEHYRPMAATNDPNKWNIRKVLTQVNKAILSLITEEAHAKEFVTIVVESKGFFIEPDMLKVYGIELPEGADLSVLPAQLLHQWQEILNVLYCAQMFPELLTKLLDIVTFQTGDKFKCLMASLWIKELANSLMKLKVAQGYFRKDGYAIKRKCNLAKYVESRLKVLSRKKPSADDQQKLLNDNLKMKLVKHEYPHLLKSFNLPNVVAVPDSMIMLELVKKAATSPSQWHDVYFNSLLQLVKDIISDEDREKVTRLTSIFLGDPNSLPNVTSNELHCVEQLNGDHDMEVTNGHDSDLSLELEQENMQGWVSYATIKGKWQGCALGILPWQHKIDPKDLMLPDEWVLYQPGSCPME